MKKLILSIAALVAFTFSGYSQCTPDPQFTIGGIYPDSATGLPAAYVGYAYDEVITVVVPLDTIVDIPIFGPTAVPFVDITLDNVTGLPPNFEYNCSPSNCVFPGNSSGCINLYSTANPTSADIGIYPLVVYVTATVDVLGVATPQPQTIDYYFIEIKDSVIPTVSFNTSSVAVDESAGTVTVDINIIDQNSNPTTVDVILGTSTATDVLDFNYTSPTIVTFPANSNTTQTVTLTIVDDAIVETSEDIVLNLQNPTNGATIGSNATTTITITDNDINPVVSFNASSITVNESAGTVTIDVNIIDQNTSPTTVDVVLGTSTATDVLDFNYTSPTTVTFPANSNTAQTVTLTIIDDAIVELSEDIVLSLQNPTNGALLGTNDSYTVTITDNDVSANPLITFDLAALTVNESVGTVTVNVEILSPSTNATSVDIALGTSTATNGDDFNYTSPTTVTFPANSNTTQTVTLTIIDDAIFEPNENIVLSLQNPTNSATIGSNGTQTITITDNDAAVISFDAATVTVNENVGTVTVNVEILSPNTNATSVDVALGISTATDVLDFNYTSPTTVTFPANSNTTQTVTLTIIDDAIFEPNENIVLSLQNPTNSATIGSNGTQTITITDNDAAVISFDAATVTVNENVGTVTVNVEILSPNTNATSVDVALGISTATDVLDFNYTSPTTVTFPANSNTTQTVTLTIIDDAIFEPNENIVLSLQNPTNTATIGSNGTQTITITDNDAAVISFDAATVTVNESVGTVTVNVEILSPNTNATSVDIALGTSTATNGDDFNYTSPTTVTFPANSNTTQTVTLTIIDDAIVETSENIVLNLQNPTNGATIGSNATTTINITDNEPNSFVENSLESIVMYPNPTSNGSITLKGIKHQNVIIEIANIIGQKVYKNTVSTNGVINLTDVSKGTYIVTLFNDADRISKKLIIE